MAQLRCAQTSELLAEGSPLEIATAADGLAAGDVIFDGVGQTFDPAAVRRAHADEIAGLQSVLAALPARAPSGEDPDAFKARKDTLAATIAERQDRIAAGQKMVAPAKKRRDDALARVEERRRRGRP
jgi:hypothetical protein